MAENINSFKRESGYYNDFKPSYDTNVTNTGTDGRSSNFNNGRIDKIEEFDFDSDNPFTSVLKDDTFSYQIKTPLQKDADAWVNVSNIQKLIDEYNVKIGEFEQKKTQLVKERDDYYNYLCELVGSDFKLFINEYNNHLSNEIVSIDRANDIVKVCGRFFSNEETTDDKDNIEWIANVIYHCLPKDSNGNSKYSVDDIVKSMSSSDRDKFLNIYDEFIDCDSELLNEALNKYDPVTINRKDAAVESYYSMLKENNLSKEEFENLQNILTIYDSNLLLLNNNIKQSKEYVTQLEYSKMRAGSEYQNFDYYRYDDVSFDLVGDYKMYNYNLGNGGLSPVDYVLYALNNDNISINKFLSNEWQEFDIHTGSASLAGDKMHDDMYDIKNLIEAGQYDDEYLEQYNYIYYLEGVDAANQFIIDNKDNINKLVAQVHVQEKLDKLKGGEYSWTDPETGQTYSYSIQVNNGKLVILGLEDGAQGFVQGLFSWVNTDSVKTVEEWEQYYLMLSFMSTEDKKANGLINEDGTSASPYIDFTVNYSQGGATQVIYNISSGIGNMLPSMALSTINPALGSVAMGVSAGGRSFRGEIVAGRDVWEAFKYGIVSGASEAVLERLLGSIPGLGKDNPAVSNFITWAKSCFDEGFEEFVQEGFDILFRKFVYGEDIDFMEALSQMGVSGLYGMATSGVLNGIQIPFQYNNIETCIEATLKENNGKYTDKQVAEMLTSTLGIEVTEDLVSDISEKHTHTENQSIIDVDEDLSPDIAEYEVKDIGEIDLHVDNTNIGSLAIDAVLSGNAQVVGRGNDKICYKVTLDDGKTYAVLKQTKSDTGTQDYLNKFSIRKSNTDKLIALGVDTPRLISCEIVDGSIYEIQEFANGDELSKRFRGDLTTEYEHINKNVSTLKLLSQAPVETFEKFINSLCILKQLGVNVDFHPDNFIYDVNTQTIKVIDIDNLTKNYDFSASASASVDFNGINAILSQIKGTISDSYDRFYRVGIYDNLPSVDEVNISYNKLKTSFLQAYKNVLIKNSNVDVSSAVDSAKARLERYLGDFKQPVIKNIDDIATENVVKINRMVARTAMYEINDIVDNLKELGEEVTADKIVSKLQEENQCISWGVVKVPVDDLLISVDANGKVKVDIVGDTLFNTEKSKLLDARARLQEQIDLSKDKKVAADASKELLPKGVLLDDDIYGVKYENTDIDGVDQGSVRKVMNAMDDESIAMQEKMIKLLMDKYPSLSQEDAVKFLRNMDLSVTKGGSDGICNYANLATSIFNLFKSIENGDKLFEEKFGFPMYWNGGFNSPQLLADMFVKINGDKFIHSYNGKYVLDSDMSNYTNINGIEHNRVYRIDVINDYLTLHDIKADISQETLMDMRQFFYDGYEVMQLAERIQNGEHISIATYGDNFELTVDDYTKKLVPGDKYIVDGPHIMPVTSINGNNLNVFTWGFHFLVDLDKAVDRAFNNYYGSSFRIDSLKIELELK